MTELSRSEDGNRASELTDDESATDAASAERLPGPSGLPLVGSTITAERDGIGFTETLSSYGDLAGYDAFGEEFVAVFDPEVVETVLVSESDAFVKGEFEMQLGELVAPEGLAFVEGEQWRRQRTALQSSFTPDKIRSYADAMVENTAVMADDWADGEVVELGDAFAGLTLRILTRALFDIDFDAERGAVVREATDAIRAMIDRFGLLSFLPEWVPTPTERRYERAMADLDALVEELIRERRADGVTRSGTPSADSDRDDLLSLLVEAADADETGIGPDETGIGPDGTGTGPKGTGMDPEAVRDQLVTFLFAGHETTATALTYACWLLAGNPAVRERLDAELDAVVGDRDPEFGDVPKLDYTERVAREALRLYPPIYSLYRQPKEEVVLDGYRIDPETTLQLSAFNIHRDERWWDDPEEFRPERWAESGHQDRPEYAYFPFGGGPRHCIGMRFAMTELQLVLATLARRVEFERVTEELDLSMGLTLNPGDVEVRVRDV